MKKHKNWLISVALLAFMGIQALAVPIGEIQDTGLHASFSDVPKTAWYAEPVNYAYSYGLINGKSSSQFAPNDYMTIAEGIALAVKTYCRYYGLDVPQQTGNHWWNSYFQYAKDVGIMGEGDDDVTAATMDYLISRGYYAHLMSRAVMRTEYPSINAITSIPDVAENDLKGRSIYLLYRAGVLSGIDATGTFQPEMPITRAEVATILSRIVDPELRIQNGDASSPNVPTVQRKDIADYVGSWSYIKVVNEDYPELTSEYAVDIFEQDGSYFLDFTYTWHEIKTMREGKILSMKENTSHLTHFIPLSVSEGVNDVYLGACEYGTNFSLELKGNSIQVYFFKNITYSMEPEIDVDFKLEDQIELIPA